MRYRQLISDDASFGSGATVFLVDSPATVAQAVLTRLRLIQGEWFLDVTAGVPYLTDVLGFNTSGTRDLAIKNVILGTQGVVSLDAYASQFDALTRRFTVTATLTTIYGETPFTAVL